jgi:ubiquinone/menaquinone biosynthesis C-methylase UbiE
MNGMGTNVDSEHERAQRLYNALAVELGPPADPLRIALAKAHRALDIGCGDGCWVLEQADLYRSKEFFGVDLDPRAVHRAANAAIVAGRRNAIFWQQSTYQELDPAMCESESFGFIRATFLARALLLTDYAKLAKALYRVTAPAGMVAWTECELPITSSPALQQIFTLVTRALDAVGHRYAPPTELEMLMMQRRASLGIKEGPRTHLGIAPYLAYWLASAGFRDVRYAAHAIDIGAYHRVMHSAFCEQAMIFMQEIQPFLFGAKVINDSAYAALLSQAAQEMADLRFCGIVFGVTCSGIKPQ